MLHLILAVEHQHQCDNGKLATGTRRQITFTATGIGLDDSDKLFHVTTRHSLTRLGIHLVSIFIRRIMGEVAADDEEILFCEPRLQHLGHPLQLREVVGGDDDGDDGWHFAQMPLQERQLHLQTMLTVVGLRLIGKHTVCLYQLSGSLTVNFYIPQRRGIIIHLTIHRSSVEPFVMTWT